MPSVDVSSVPGFDVPCPTTMNIPLPHAAPIRFRVVVDVRAVHVTPSGDVNNFPALPVATKRSLPKATPFN